MTYKGGGFPPSFKADYEQDGLAEDGIEMVASDCLKIMLCFGTFADSATATRNLGRHITWHSLVVCCSP
jgi:hypothetical protein